MLKIPKKISLNLQRNPLIWALPLQALLLLSNLDLLDPWADEWFDITTVPQPVSQVVSAVAGNVHPPLYFVLLHYWIQLPWPLSPVASMRAMSAVWALVATVVIYVLWLRPERPRFQADVSCAVGTFAMPTATCPHGALVQHAASACLAGDLLRPTVG